MTKHRDAKRDGESISDWIERVSYRNDSWLKKAKRRRKFRWYYDLKFYIQLKYIRI